MFNSFWWGRKSTGGRGINWCRWEQLCKPKTVGGLGFKKLYDFNLSLLSKQGWKFLSDHSALVTQIYRAKYFQHTFLHANLGSNPSYTWRSIHATKDLIRKHSRFRVGDGSQIMVTQDSWIPKDGSGMISTDLGEAYVEATIKQLMKPEERKWDEDLVTYVFNSRDGDSILNILLSLRIIEDKWYWK